MQADNRNDANHPGMVRNRSRNDKRKAVLQEAVLELLTLLAPGMESMLTPLVSTYLDPMEESGIDQFDRVLTRAARELENLR